MTRRRPKTPAEAAADRLCGAWPDVCLSTKAEAMLPSAKTLMQALAQSGAEIARLEAEVSLLRGQLSVAERDLKASKDGAKALKAELDRLRARAAVPPPAPVQAPVPAAPPATRFSLLEVD